VPVVTDVVLLAVGVWLILAVVLGLALARVLGGISHARADRRHEDDEHLARSA
jgi:hypothetical protein